MNQAAKPFTGRKTFAWFAGFFAVVIGVNLVMVAFAIQSFTGVDEDDAYKRGRNFASELAAAKSAQALDWRVTTEIQTQSDGATLLRVNYIDAKGKPLSGLTLIGVFRRPTQKALDRPVSLQASAPGGFEGRVELPLAGLWEVRLLATDSAGNQLETRRRIQIEVP